MEGKAFHDVDAGHLLPDNCAEVSVQCHKIESTRVRMRWLELDRKKETGNTQYNFGFGNRI